jgi:hypothetical protein
MLKIHYDKLGKVMWEKKQNHGQAYTSVAGNEMPVLLPGLTCPCYRKCFNR